MLISNINKDLQIRSILDWTTFSIYIWEPIGQPRSTGQKVHFLVRWNIWRAGNTVYGFFNAIFALKMIIFKAVLYLQKKVRKDFYSGFDKIFKNWRPFKMEFSKSKEKSLISWIVRWPFSRITIYVGVTKDKTWSKF